MSNADNQIIPLKEDDQGEEFRAFYDEFQKRMDIACGIPKELLGNENPRSDVVVLQVMKQRLSKTVKGG